MRCKGNFNAEFQGLSLVVNKKRNGKNWIAKFRVWVKKELAVEQWGQELFDLAFGGAHDSVDVDGNPSTGHFCKTIKPTERVSFERHEITFGEHAHTEEFRVTDVSPIEGHQAAWFHCSVSIPTVKTNVINAIVEGAPTHIPVKFYPENDDITESGPGFTVHKGGEQEQQQQEQPQSVAG